MNQLRIANKLVIATIQKYTGWPIYGKTFLFILQILLVHCIQCVHLKSKKKNIQIKKIIKTSK
jgi:hypothetical protein